MPRIYRSIGVSPAGCFTGLIVALLTTIAGTHKVWSDDVIRSATPSAVYLRQIASIPFESQRPDGSSVLSLAWSPDGRRLAASFDWGFQVAVLDTSTWQEVSRIKGKSFQPEHQLAFVSNSQIVTSPEENHSGNPSVLAFYDTETGHLIKSIARPSGYARGSIVGLVVPTSRNYVVPLLDDMLPVPLRFGIDSGQFLGRLSTPPESTSHVIAAGPGDKVGISVSYTRERARSEVRKEIYLIDAATNSVDRILAGHVPGIGSLAWSPDGRWIASGASMLEGNGDKKWIRDSDSIRIWDATTGELAASFVGMYDPVPRLAWHPSSAVLASESAKGNGERGSAVRLWSTSRKEMIFDYLAPDGGLITALSFNPRTGHLVWGWRGTLRVFEVEGL
jgi:WD40 repeat protein